MAVNGVSSDSSPFPVEHALLYELLVSELTDFVVVLLDPGGRFASWNPGVQKNLGYTAEEVIGQPSSILFTARDREAGIPEQEMQTARENGRATDIRWHLRRDGSLMFGEGVMVALRAPDGSLLGFSKVMRDVTARKQNEDRLEELTEALRQAQIIVRSPDGVIRFWGDGARRLYGFSEAEALGSTSWELLKTESPLTPEDLRRILATERTWHGEVRNCRRDGSRVIVRIDAVLRQVPSTGEQVIIEAATDISELKRAEESLLRSNEDLQHFVYAASHDLQEPLRMIRTYSELLSRRYGSKFDPDADLFVRRISEGANRMETLLRELLAWSQSSDGSEVPRQQVDMNEVLSAALSVLQHRVEETGATITSDRLPVVLGHAHSLAQVLQNLLLNGIKYGGDDPPRIHVSVRLEGEGFWQFSVHDNGVGFDPGDAEKIFRAFTRLHGAERQGTGIGLALCRKIVERHRGRIWAQSEPGRGSTFHFTLPAGSQ